MYSVDVNIHWLCTFEFDWWDERFNITIDISSGRESVLTYAINVRPAHPTKKKCERNTHTLSVFSSLAHTEIVTCPVQNKMGTFNRVFGQFHCTVTIFVGALCLVDGTASKSKSSVAFHLRLLFLVVVVHFSPIFRWARCRCVHLAIVAENWRFCFRLWVFSEHKLREFEISFT